MPVFEAQRVVVLIAFRPEEISIESCQALGGCLVIRFGRVAPTHGRRDSSERDTVRLATPSSSLPEFATGIA